MKQRIYKINYILILLSFCFAFSAVAQTSNETKEQKDFKLWMSIASKGDASAEFNVGWAYARGYGINKNIQEAHKWFTRSAGKGHLKAMNGLGLLYLEEAGMMDYRKAFFWFTKAANTGHAIAQSNLAVMYVNGSGVESDLLKAKIWAKKAADQGDKGAINILEEIEKRLSGISTDTAENSQARIDDYKKHAEHGNTNAQINLANAYQDGNGVPKDLVKAAYWYSKAAEQNDKDAQYQLALCYENGKGVEQDDLFALYWYQKSAIQGHANAQNNLGLMYHDGRGTKKRRDLAIHWLQKAVAQGNETAATNLRAIDRIGVELE